MYIVVWNCDRRFLSFVKLMYDSHPVKKEINAFAESFNPFQPVQSMQDDIP